MGVIIFNGKASTDYGIIVENPPSYQIPKRRVESISVPGRNGNIIIDEGVYDNVPREYNIAAGDRYEEKFTELAQSISHWLNSAHGNYARLEDSYEPEYFRMAVYSEEVEIENVLQQAGRATISFDCKPQRYLKRGENVVKIVGQKTDSSVPPIHTIYNPTQFAAAPLLTIRNTTTGSNIPDFKLNVNNHIIVGTDIGAEAIIIDSEMLDIYGVSGQNLNSKVELMDFPLFNPGINNIGLYCQNYYLRLEVKPRWWVI